MHRRLTDTISVRLAVGNSPALARLAELIKESNNRFLTIESLIPPNLRSAVKAGPVDSESWCLLITGNAAMAKIRQLLPSIQTRLVQQGWKNIPIRLKMLVAKR